MRALRKRRPRAGPLLNGQSWGSSGVAVPACLTSATASREKKTTTTTATTTAATTIMVEPVGIITGAITLSQALKYAAKVARRVRAGLLEGDALSEAIGRDTAAVEAALQGFEALLLAGHGDDPIYTTKADLPKSDDITGWAGTFHKIALLSQGVIQGISEDLTAIPPVSGRKPDWLINIKKKEDHDKWRREMQVTTNLLETILGPVHLKNFEMLAHEICPSLNRIEEGQRVLQAGQMAIQLQLQDLKELPISTHHPIPPTSNGQLSASTPAKSSTLISLFERSGFNLQYYAIRGNAKRYGVLARMRLGPSLAVVAEVSGRYFMSPFSIRPGLSIAFRGLVPEDSEILSACKNGHSRKVQQLLTAGAAGPNDSSPSNITLLSAAITSGDLATVEMLIQSGANVNIGVGHFQTSPIQLATLLQQPEIARVLIRNHADLEYVSEKGWSILHHIFWEDTNPHSAEFLRIFRASDVAFDTAKDFAGFNTLHKCAATGTREDITDLVKLFGAHKYWDSRNNVGSAPIHVAAGMGNMATLEALLECNMEQSLTRCLNLQDSTGWTPLHHSIYSRQTETMRWLIQQGADYHIPTFPVGVFFPDGHEGKVFHPADLASLQGKDMVLDYVEALREVRPDVTQFEGDVFFDTPEGSDQSEDGDSGGQSNSTGGNPVCEKSFL